MSNLNLRNEESQMRVEKLLELVSKALGPSIHTGKVRVSYPLRGLKGEDLLLVIATDNISIFDFVLGFPIDGKGEVLTAINIFWRLQIKQKLPWIAQDLVAFGRDIDKYLPKALRKNTFLMCRAVVVRKFDMIQYEFIERGYLTGSGYAAYRDNDRLVCGHLLPEGLVNGSKLEVSIPTPSTKAKKGHDEHVTYQEVEGQHGALPHCYQHEIFRLMSHVCYQRWLIPVDTKFEFAWWNLVIDTLPLKVLVLCDEVGTQDSTRYWDKHEYDQVFPNRLPDSPDKEYMRIEGRKLGIHLRDPKNPHDVAWVLDQKFSREVIVKTEELYDKFTARLTGQYLGQFQSNVMSIY
jgi:phosphoribosylaminoimidazole-succinocarboxamide synthase